MTGQGEVADAMTRATREFMRYAPAILSCDGDPRCEDIQRRRPSVAAARVGLEYWQGEVARLEAESFPDALAAGLSFLPDYGG